jgi:ATP synthase protein I
MNKKSEKKKLLSDLNESYKQVGPYLGLGTQLAASLTILTLLGYFLDKQFLTKPLYTLIGAFLGAAAGLYNFIKTIKNIDNKKGKNEGK